ncbi:DNA-processing protein DprA [Pseudodesulfovibrio senegalensis]|uniref:DNA-protecting protein DprA n=1 Tax=Pseudodesulfovibrio senegalensis TaxID=1721087 RepID=A0A6N6N2F3_9BACT|nr:DNA-processing protein DprA [Pseudodesulfovibrio senegalensis]KAB1440371.1 DNA-protecting protein DprA [Pseudodesulfovibrio senegalensis]
MSARRDPDKEFFACLAFRHAKGVGHKTWRTIFNAYDSAYEALLDADAWPDKGLADRRRANAVLNEGWREKARAEYLAVRDADMQVVCWHDNAYPDRLRNIMEPPALLYCRGDVSLLRNPSVAVVGARKCTHFGLESAERISYELSSLGITVVSGLALGIDRQAHLAGLRGLGRSVAVLGAGMDQDYPSDNADVREVLERRGCVVTEYPPGMRADPANFPFRNRIISGLSLGVVVAEAANRSGSLITARLASEEGREVFALPGPLGQPTFTGCHGLIKQGAALVECAADIVEVLRYEFAGELDMLPDAPPRGAEDPDALPGGVIRTASANRRKSSRPLKTAKAEPIDSVPRKSRQVPIRAAVVLDAEEQELMDVLEESGKQQVDSLCRSLGWPSGKTSRMLLMLEMRGAVRQLPGMWYLARESEPI